MDLTKKFLKAKNPCTDGFRWFLRTHQNGADYQAVLDTLIRDGRVDDACWLLKQFGPTNAVLTLDELHTSAIVFAGSIEVKGNIEVDMICAGRSIKAGGGLRAEQNIVAGEDIRVAGSIRCAGSLDAGGDIRTAWGIELGGALHCGGNIRVGWDLSCNGPLRIAGNAHIGQDFIAGDSARCGKNLRIGGSVTATDTLHSAHGIEVGAAIFCRRHLEAGLGIKARGAIIAEGSIKVGESLQSEQDIQAGAGYGIYAGTIVPVECWETSAQVRARSKPERLMSGYWCPTHSDPSQSGRS